MTRPLRNPSGARVSRRPARPAAPTTPDRPSDLLDPEVLERYLLLLSLDVEVQRIIEEQRLAMEEIDRARAALDEAA